MDFNFFFSLKTLNELVLCALCVMELVYEMEWDGGRWVSGDCYLPLAPVFALPPSGLRTALIGRHQSKDSRHI